MLQQLRTVVGGGDNHTADHDETGQHPAQRRAALRRLFFVLLVALCGGSGGAIDAIHREGLALDGRGRCAGGFEPLGLIVGAGDGLQQRRRRRVALEFGPYSNSTSLG